MIWLTWRQHRRQALFTVLGLAALAVFVVPTGLSMRHDQRTLDPGRFADTYGSLALLSILLLVVPLLIGLFWGAPLIAREIEHGTHRMIWTQGITRRHWALAKVGLLGGAVVVFALVYGLGLAWWYQPLGQIDVRQTRFAEIFFDMQGVAPVGYTIFAVALGVVAGTMVPKVLPAMALTLTGFVGVRAAVALFARPHYMTPVAADQLVRGATGKPTGELDGAWVLAKEVRRADGTFVTNGTFRCPATGACAGDTEMGPGAYNHQLIQPGDRFWAFQWIELGIFVALAALLVWLAVRRVRRLA
ncbi:ABC transporter permease [Paractinoplanes globisporus]|uniref:ABC transporter permease n=1 Tax=Paractinoplanes globisporus TaxID=113565 RepID=A0ABW6W8Y1_9ACTN|nr:ABC transporter permease [Actinoplanes globisporus]